MRSAVPGDVRNTRSVHLFLILLGTLLLCMGVSGVSLWIDEGTSAKLAAQPTLHGWASTLNAIEGSEPQMPGYQLYLWAWSRLFGISEWALRLANLPWAALFVFSLSWAAERLFKIRWAWLIICLSPFGWFYMNEARPYAMVLGLAMATTVALLAYAREPARFRLTAWATVFFLLLIWFTHMLAIILLPSLILFLLVLRPVSIKQFLQDWSRPVLASLPLYLCLAAYYAFTLAAKKGGAKETPGLSNVAFALYEFLGFSGLGPPRNALRHFSGIHMLVPYAPTLILGLVAMSLVAASILVQIRRSSERRTVLALFLAFLTGLILTLALSYAAHFRLLGRHMAAFVVMLDLLLLAGLLPGNGKEQRRLAFGAMVLLSVAWLVSDYRDRVLPSYQKDNYRSATAVAQKALSSGQPVFWLADPETAKYYGLKTDLALRSSSTVSPDDETAASGSCSPIRFSKLLRPGRQILVVISDRDYFDPQHGCRNLLDSMNPVHVASFNDFDIWQATPSPGLAAPR